MDWTAKAREWLNKKHFTSDSGVTLDCLAMLPEEHAMAINIRQLRDIMAAFASEVERETLERAAKSIDNRPEYRFSEDDIRRDGLPKDVFGLLHDLCWHHDGRDVWNYVRRAQEMLRKMK